MFDAEPGLMIWTFITFVLLLFILKKFVYKPILNFMDERENKIKETIDSVEKKKEEAVAILEKYNKQMSESKEDAKKIIDESRKIAEQKKNEIIENARQEANHLILKAKEEINNEKKAAISELHETIADISVSIASRLITRSISKDDHVQLFNDYLNKMEVVYGNN